MTNFPSYQFFQTKFKVWEKARSVDRFADNNKYGATSFNPQPHTRGIFSSANTGSVNLVKSRFERKSSTPSTPLLGPRQKSATPFRNTRTPSPPFNSSFAVQPSLRRRSPSPIKTGAVNKVKNRFETENNFATNSGAEKYQTAAAKELSSSQQHLSSSHQTLPKAFKTSTSPNITSTMHDANLYSFDRKMPTSIPTSQAGGSYTKPSSFNPVTKNIGTSKLTNYRPVRTVGSHIASQDTNFSLSHRPPLSGIQESTLLVGSQNNSNSSMISSSLKRQDSTGKTKAKQDSVVSPELSLSLSSSRGSQFSSKTPTGTSAKRPAMVGSIPSRFMNQDVINDAAYFISQKLSNVSPSPPVRNRNLSAGSIPSSTTSSTTSPHLSQTPKHIRGPFGYTDL